jgi:hypothetical protein
MLIIPQQQGSCTWFCKYWSLVLISLIKKKYSEFVNSMYNICIRDLTRLLYTDFLDNEIDYMISIKILLSKLSNLKILQPKNQIQFFDLNDKSKAIIKFKPSSSSSQKSITDDITDMGSLITLLLSNNYTERDYLQIFKIIIELRGTLEERLKKIENITEDKLTGLSTVQIKYIMNALKYYNQILEVIDRLTKNHIYFNKIKLFHILMYLDFQPDDGFIKYCMKLEYYFSLLHTIQNYFDIINIIYDINIQNITKNFNQLLKSPRMDAIVMN